MTTRSPFRLAAALTVASGLATACVPATRFDQTKTALDSEQAAHRAAQARVTELQQRLAAAEADARDSKARLLEHENKLAASNLSSDLAATERDDANTTIEQLRGELARASEHLRAFAQQKDELSRALAAAEARSAAPVAAPPATPPASAPASASLTAEKAALIRDAALAFHAALAAGSYELVFSEGKPTLLIPLSAVVAGETLSKAGDELVQGLVQFSALHANMRVALRAEGVEPELATRRARQLADKLRAAGLSEAQLVQTSPPPPELGAGFKRSPAQLRVELIAAEPPQASLQPNASIAATERPPSTTSSSPVTN